MLSGKNKRILRAYANKLKPTVIIGKDNVNDNIINSINNSLFAHELVKISVLKTASLTLNQLTIEIVEKCKCELVGTIGRTILLYKESDKKIYSLV